ncbi:hypothetical protein SAMN05421856_1193 [Chryseobacterium taichungense]|uniref:Uncharacterized protein n=1 Tax=Chryseobacterium taichungense TaxID=295069 RepID=A0A1H8DWL6_9FLAO|nr:hypothetical protein [Chryseobacterium taichungense]SEN11556.1 hypothetical protein SAMN05421856_1193 [Chryseobacterium taichungense]
MEKVWNKVYYNIYLFEVNTTYAFRTILNFIFSPITKINFLKKSLEKKGSSFKHIDDIALKVSNNREYGKSINFANIQIGGLLVILEYCLFNFLQALLGKSLIQYVWEYNRIYTLCFIIIMLLIPYIINNKLLWENDKYLKYFEEFDQDSKHVRYKWAWISLGIIASIILLFILSLIVTIKVLG